MYTSKLMSRKQLLEITRSHFPRSNRLQILLRLQRLISEVEYQKTHHAMRYSYSKRKMVAKEKVGGYWARQGKQHRWKELTSPKRRRGRPAEAWRRVLISLLGFEFYRGTENPPTRGATNGSPSAFQCFAAPFLSAFRIQDKEGLVREYIKERRKQNPYQLN